MRSKQTTTLGAIGTAAPVVAVPRPRATTGTRASAQARNRAWTSLSCAGSATASTGPWRLELS